MKCNTNLGKFYHDLSWLTGNRYIPSFPICFKSSAIVPRKKALDTTPEWLQTWVLHLGTSARFKTVEHFLCSKSVAIDSKWQSFYSILVCSKPILFLKCSINAYGLCIIFQVFWSNAVSQLLGFQFVVAWFSISLFASSSLLFAHWFLCWHKQTNILVRVLTLFIVLK